MKDAFTNLKKEFTDSIKRGGFRFVNVLKWVLIGAAIGGLCGLLGTAFDITVNFALNLRAANSWIIYLAPLGGLLITAIYTLLKVRGQDTNTIITAVHSSSKVSIKLFPSIYRGTAITHLVGGSAGREGAALQMGGSLGSFVGRGLRLKNEDLSIAVLAGMAGYFSAIFGTPIAAAIFVITIIRIGVSIFDALVPCVSSALAAYGIAKLLGVEGTHFNVSAPAFDWIMLLRVAALAVLSTVVAVIFYKTIHGAGKLFSKIIPNLWLRAAIGGCCIIAFALIYGSQRYSGTGMGIITEAIENGQAFWWDWILKIVLTAITLGMGFKGGEVVPSFFVGATFGCFMGGILGLDPGFAAAVGLVCVFCAATNSPLASIILAMELFGSGGLVYYALACALSFILSGNSSLYSAQKVEELSAFFAEDESKGEDTAE